jgi:hypothetical protein
MKLLLITILLCLLTGCEKPVNEWKTNVTNVSSIKALDGCSRIEINTGERKEVVYRCPFSITTTQYSCGKGCEAKNTVIDSQTVDINKEEEYNKKQKIIEIQSQISKLNSDIEAIKNE